MSDYVVNPSSLTSGAGKIDGVAEANTGTANAMTPPPTMMLGLFFVPFVETLGAALHNQAVELVRGVAHENKMVAENLRITAQNYSTAEDHASTQAGRIQGGAQ